MVLNIEQSIKYFNVGLSIEKIYDCTCDKVSGFDTVLIVLPNNFTLSFKPFIYISVHLPLKSGLKNGPTTEEFTKI